MSKKSNRNGGQTPKPAEETVVDKDKVEETTDSTVDESENTNNDAPAETSVEGGDKGDDSADNSDPSGDNGKIQEPARGVDQKDDADPEQSAQDDAPVAEQTEGDTPPADSDVDEQSPAEEAAEAAQEEQQVSDEELEQRRQEEQAGLHDAGENSVANLQREQEREQAEQEAQERGESLDPQSGTELDQSQSPAEEAAEAAEQERQEATDQVDRTNLQDAPAPSDNQPETATGRQQGHSPSDAQYVTNKETAGIVPPPLDKPVSEFASQLPTRDDSLGTDTIDKQAHIDTLTGENVGNAKPATAEQAEAVAVAAQQEEEQLAEEDDTVKVGTSKKSLQQHLEMLEDQTKNISEAQAEEIRDALVKGRRNHTVTHEFYIEGLRRLAALQHHDTNEWEENHLTRWGEHKVDPSRERGGLLQRSRVRNETPLNKWSDKELVALVKREIYDTPSVSYDEGAKELARRNNLDPLLSPEQIRIWVTTAKLPTDTHRNSDMFQLKPAYYWTDAELQGFFDGAISETKTVKRADVYNEYRRRHELSESSYSDERIQSLQGKNSKGAKKHMALTILSAELKNYAEKMNPSASISERDAGAMQTALFKQMQRVLSLPGQDFVSGWTELLDFVHTNQDSLFHESRRMRGLAYVQLGRDRETFEQLLNLCIRTADPKVRYQAAKTTNFGAVLATVTDEKVRQKLLSYYRVGQ